MQKARGRQHLPKKMRNQMGFLRLAESAKWEVGKIIARAIEPI
jgi:hypothetical protein